MLAVIALALLLPLQGQDSSQDSGQGQGRGGRGGGRRQRPVVDLAVAQKQMLEKDPQTADDFIAVANAATQESTRRKLPSFLDNAEATYGPEQLALRVEAYGPLLAEPRTHEFLRSLVRHAATGWFDVAGQTAALVLADAPDEADFAALFEGYQATTSENRSGIARQLGRAIASMNRRPPPPPAIVEQALAQLKADAVEGKASPRGAAIEGLFRADHSELAIEILRPLLSQEGDPLETMTILQACSRLFKRDDLDPFMRARAVATAETAIETLLASTDELTATQVISGKGRTLRAAISFLQDAGGEGAFALMMRCLESERAHVLLGIDGLQSLRFGLQRRRATATPEQAAALDGHWLQIVVDAGNRLFALEEEPMDQDEQSAFWDARDLRYNAIGYFVDQFSRASTVEGVLSVKERIGKEPDLPTLLATIVRAKENVSDEEGGATRYHAVAEKIENRVLALQLLTLIEREWNRDPAGLDLFTEAYLILVAEIQSPLMAVETMVEFRRTRGESGPLTIPIGKRPGDNWVQSNAVQTIANLGYVVHTSPQNIVVEPDHDAPWPWPDRNAPAPGPSPAPAANPGGEPKRE